MFELIYNFVDTLRKYALELKVQVPTNTYVITSHILAIVYFAVLVMMYLFMAFGLKGALVKRNKAPTFKVWVPLLQFAVMVDLVEGEKLFKMSKKTFSILIITLCLISRVSSLTYDLIAYSKSVFSVLYSVENISFKLNAVGPMWLSTIYSLSDLAFSVFLVLLSIAYFKTRSASYVSYVVVSVLFGVIATSILVFATRNREDVKPRFYVYPNNTQKTNSQGPFGEFSNSEPFSEFKQNETENQEPFSEFSNENVEEKKATDFIQEQENKNSNTSDDDDMF